MTAVLGGWNMLVIPALGKPLCYTVRLENSQEKERKGKKVVH